MKFFSLICGTLLSALLSGCAFATPVGKAEKELEEYFNIVLRLTLREDYAKAYALAREGRTEAIKSQTAIPEKYSALVKILVRRGVDESIPLLRELYSTERMSDAKTVADLALDALKEESMPIPDTLARIHKKITEQRVELFFYDREKPRMLYRRA